jgi:uncharacterized protein (DUF342 family)
MFDEQVHTESVRVEADTLDKALEMAAEQLGVAVAALHYQVEQVGARGFLGLGHRPFIVSAKEAIGDVRVRKTKSGVYLWIAPPMTLHQAEHTLASRGTKVDAEGLSRALEAPPHAWFRIGDGEPSAPGPTAKITLSEDEMTATVELTPVPEGGRTLDPEEVIELLAAQAITFGISNAAVVDALDNERFDHPVVVAHGEPAQHGTDATIRYHFRTDKSHVLLKEDEHGQIDFHDVGLFEDVIVGQLLAEKLAATGAGKEGRTVTDELVPARDGVGEVTLQAGKNTLLSEDGCSLTAAIAGQVLFAAGVASVEPVLEIRGNVDFKTGNIDSQGSVIVRGDVTEGFHVTAQGNIDVHGLVEAATLRAKGDIIVHKGVLGKGAASLQAGGDVFAKFVDRVKLRAGRDAIIGGEILTSEVRAGRLVKCEGARGSIVGGHVSAVETITAATIGSRLCVSTFVNAGAMVTGTNAVYPGVRVTVKGATLEVQDLEHAARFVEKEGEVVRVSSV